MLVLLFVPIVIGFLIAMYGWPLFALLFWASESESAKKVKLAAAEAERVALAQAALEQRRHEELVAACAAGSRKAFPPPVFDLGD